MTKEHLNNRGYNKFLKLTGKVAVEIDEPRIEQAARWDGLKGYVTNTALPPDEIIDNYGLLLPTTVPKGAYKIAVGLYDPVSGQRLPVSAGPQSYAIELGPIDVLPGGR